MPIENSWGKSAVDATRKNALPPYLDSVFSEGLGSGVTIVDLTLDSSGWTTETYVSGSTSVNYTYWYKDFDFGTDEKGKPNELTPTTQIIMLPYAPNANAAGQYYYGATIVSHVDTSIRISLREAETSNSDAVSAGTPTVPIYMRLQFID